MRADSAKIWYFAVRWFLDVLSMSSTNKRYGATSLLARLAKRRKMVRKCELCGTDLSNTVVAFRHRQTCKSVCVSSESLTCQGLAGGNRPEKKGEPGRPFSEEAVSLVSLNRLSYDRMQFFDEAFELLREAAAGSARSTENAHSCRRLLSGS